MGYLKYLGTTKVGTLNYLSYDQNNLIEADTLHPYLISLSQHCRSDDDTLSDYWLAGQEADSSVVPLTFYILHICLNVPLCATRSNPI